MQEDFIIVLAWPEGMVTAPGSWYDKIASKKGKYRVGHSAIVLINNKTKKSHYFDFGRYHTPKGFGRVRDEETDLDLTLQNAITKHQKILNVEEILQQIIKIKTIYAKGRLYASVVNKIDFQSAYKYAKKIQNKGMLKYGPFVVSGTNCSRFSAAVIRHSNPSFVKKLRLYFPFCISPSPKRNVSISNNNYYVVDKQSVKRIKKNKIKAYFTSIEI